MRKCKHCGGKLKPKTVPIEGTDEVGMCWKCDSCNISTFSEIISYTGFWISDERHRRRRLRER